MISPSWHASHTATRHEPSTCCVQEEAWDGGEEGAVLFFQQKQCNPSFVLEVGFPREFMQTPPPSHFVPGLNELATVPSLFLLQSLVQIASEGPGG